VQTSRCGPGEEILAFYINAYNVLAVQGILRGRSPRSTLGRALFEELGGFPEQPMEDIAFSLRLRAVIRPIMLQSPVVTDARKFDCMRHWRGLWATR
jgi:hypothetical protein